MKKVLILPSCVIAALVGCTPPTGNAHSFRLAIAHNRACTTPIMADPAYAPLREHGLLGDPADTPMSALSDQTYISLDESRLVEQLHDALQPCHDQTRADMAMVDPRFSEVLTAEYEASDQNIVDLIQRRETWGQFAERRQAVSRTAQKAFIEVAQSIDDRLRAENEEEAALRQQAISSAILGLQAASQRPTFTPIAPIAPPALPPLQPPINCTSRVVFNSLATTCN